MKKIVFFSFFSLISCLLSFAEIQSAFAQTVTLGIPNPSSITFNDADPDSTPSLVANSTVTISIRVQNNSGQNWRLTHLAAGDLSPSIPISNISWNVTPRPPFVNGSMSRSVAQIAAQGTGNLNPASTGTFTFIISNLWSYNTGNFSVATSFTLSAP